MSLQQKMKTELPLTGGSEKGFASYGVFITNPELGSHEIPCYSFHYLHFYFLREITF
jgi:hypothetical protein